MDTADFNSESSMYEFVKNGAAIPGTRIVSDAGLPHPAEGKSAIYDTTPASNTIFLKLEEEDEVAVRQLMETDIPDYHVSFCGSLIHLEKVSFSLRPSRSYYILLSGLRVPQRYAGGLH